MHAERRASGGRAARRRRCRRDPGAGRLGPHRGRGGRGARRPGRRDREVAGVRRRRRADAGAGQRRPPGGHRQGRRACSALARSSAPTPTWCGPPPASRSAASRRSGHPAPLTTVVDQHLGDLRRRVGGRGHAARRVPDDVRRAGPAHRRHAGRRRRDALTESSGSTAAEFRALAGRAASVYGAAMRRSPEVVVQRREIIAEPHRLSGLPAAGAFDGDDRRRPASWSASATATSVRPASGGTTSSPRALGRDGTRALAARRLRARRAARAARTHQGARARPPPADRCAGPARGHHAVLSTPDTESPARLLYRSYGFRRPRAATSTSRAAPRPTRSWESIFDRGWKPLRERRSDVVVVGAGHNGLVAACYLARAGLDVEVVERDTVIGGAVSTVERWPGVRVDRGSSIHVMVRHTGIVEDLAPRRVRPGVRRRRAVGRAPPPRRAAAVLAATWMRPVRRSRRPAARRTPTAYRDVHRRVDAADASGSSTSLQRHRRRPGARPRGLASMRRQRGRPRRHGRAPSSSRPRRCSPRRFDRPAAARGARLVGRAVGTAATRRRHGADRGHGRDVPPAARRPTSWRQRAVERGARGAPRSRTAGRCAPVIRSRRSSRAPTLTCAVVTTSPASGSLRERSLAACHVADTARLRR